jgi:hypothetical protein
MVVVIAAWLIVGLLLAGVGVIIYLGVDSVVRGWQLLEQRREVRLNKETDQ